MRVTFIRNSPSVGPGLIEEYLRKDDDHLIRTLTPEDVLSRPFSHVMDDLVVVLGSPLGVYQTDIPWILRQRHLMRALVEKSVPVFGVCFGAQLLATAVGGDVRPMSEFITEWRENDGTSAEALKGPWLRWHGDQIFLPPAMESLACDRGVVQAFKVDCAVGVQFHPEVSAELLTAWAFDDDTRIDQLKAAQQFAAENAQSVRERAFALFDYVLSEIL